MNAEQKYERMIQLGDPAECVSALVDGEIDEAEIDALFAAGDAVPDLHARWHCYQLLGDALRNGAPAVPLRAPQSFLAGVMAGLSETGSASLKLDAPATVVHLRAPAANDAVIRWKVLAGVASAAAVVAVSWSALSGTPGGASGAPAASVQLAAGGGQAQGSLTLSQPVAVKTDQGTLIRDARLEQLLAEHRQYGGASALQMPAGFLRNATYESVPQR